MLKETITFDALQSCDINGPIEKSTCVDCDEFEPAFLEAARQADQSGNVGSARAYRTLASLCSFHFIPDDKIEPFSNKMALGDGSRTLIGSDFDAAEVNAIGDIVPTVKNLALRTRLADFVWSRNRAKTDFARIAIDGYVELVEGLIAGTLRERFGDRQATGIGSEQFLKRAMLIARATGWPKPENDKVRDALRAVVRLAAARNDMDIVRFGRLALQANLDGVEDVFAGLEAHVDKLLSMGESFTAEAVQELHISRLRRLKDDERVKEAQLKLSRIFENRAHDVSGAMLKAHALQQAIDTLHGVKGVKEERQRLHEKLKEAQLHMVDEFGAIEHSLDLTDEIERILAQYESLDLLDCLRRMALAEMPKPPETLIAKAREEAQNFPLSSLFATSLVDEKGRTIARADGGGIENEETLRYKVIQQEQIRLSISVAGHILPLRQLITDRFTLEHDLLVEICRISPFVPSGLEHTFARGMKSFIYGDDFLAVAALVPALESGLRSLVSAAGRADTKIMAGGIEQTIGLGPLFANHRDVLEKVFTPAIIYCLENLLIHELGPKIRHHYCHGLTPDGAYFGEPHVYACKLIFALVILPLAGENWPAVKDHLNSKLT